MKCVEFKNISWENIHVSFLVNIYGKMDRLMPTISIACKCLGTIEISLYSMKSDSYTILDRHEHLH